MSETVEEVEIPTRRSRAERPAREIHREPDTSVVIEEDGADSVSPEEALADTTRQLRERDDQLATARRMQREAEQRRAEAERVAATTRGSASVTAIEAATAEQSAAEAAYIRAREAGDLAAEIAANKALSAATMRLAAATYEADQLKSQAPAQQAARQNGPSPAAQAWLDAHPAYHTDRKYRGTAEVAHGEAVRAGMPVGSQEYVDYIDQIMTQEYGAGHGQTGQREVTAPRQGRSAAPPSHNHGGNRAGWKSVRVPAVGEIQFQIGADGQPGRIKASQEILANLKEAAEFSRMSLEDYAKDLVQGSIEGNPDLIRGEGGRYE